MIRPLALLCLFFCCFKNHAQDGHYELGARSSGMSGTSVTTSDSWSMFNNVGGLGNVKKSVAGLSYRNRYGIAPLNTVGASYIHTAKWFNSGISFYRFGDELYNQQRLSFGIGNRFQMVSMGVSASIVQYFLENIGSKKVLIMEFGGIVELLPELILGAHIFNFSQSSVNDLQSIPIIMKTGLSYRPIESLMVNMELKKEIDMRENISFGVEYAIIKWVMFRTGFSIPSGSLAFGLGLVPGRFEVDYGFNIQEPIGAIHEFSIAYHTQK